MKGLKTTIILVIVAICVVVGINRGIEAKETEETNIVAETKLGYMKTLSNTIITDELYSEDELASGDKCTWILRTKDRKAVTICDDWKIIPEDESETTMELYINGHYIDSDKDIFLYSKKPGMTVDYIQNFIAQN